MKRNQEKARRSAGERRENEKKSRKTRRSAEERREDEKKSRKNPSQRGRATGK